MMIILLVLAVCLIAVLIITLVKQAVKAETNKYYLFDLRVVDRAQRAELKVGPTEKTTTDAAWLDQYSWTADSDIPDWEHRISIMYPHVEYDKENGKYKMWYEAWYAASPTAGFDWRDNLIDASNSKNVDLGTFINTARGTVYDGKDVLCYMESMDGINWTRPDCGEFYYRTQSGEIIGTNIVYVGNHGNGVEINEHPDTSEPKYLMAGRAYEVSPESYAGTEPVGVAISWSEDGIHWEAPVTIKCSYECADDIHYVRADTHNQLKYSPELGRYVVITRGYAEYNHSARQVVYLEATDSLTSIRQMAEVKAAAGENYWEATSEYWTDAEVTLDQNVDLGAQPYSMPAIHVSKGYYIGVVSVADFTDDEEGVWNQVHTELTWSPDGKNWYYMDKGTPFICNAEAFEYKRGNDYGMIYCAAPIEVGDKVQIYYAAVPELHYTAYSQVPAGMKSVLDVEIPKSAEVKAVTRTTALNVATIGKDRYAGYFSEDGTVTMGRFGVKGGDLRLTVDVADGGSVKVAVLDSARKVIEGYGFDDFTAIEQSATDQAVAWGKKTLSSLSGESVYLQIQLNNATVYTISGNIESLTNMDIVPVDE